VSEFHSLIGDSESAEKWMEKAKKLQKAIEQILWCEEDGVWYDFDLVNEVNKL